MQRRSYLILLVLLMIVMATSAFAAPRPRVQVAYTSWDGIWFVGATRPAVSSPGLFSGMPTLSPDGRSLAYTTTADSASYWLTLHVYDIRSRWNYQVTAGHYDIAPCWSPDGRKLAFARNMAGPDKIHWMDVSNPRRPSEPARLTDWPSYYSEESPSWARTPEGEIIAIETDRDHYARMGIWAKNLTTDEEYPLVDEDNMTARDPSLLPSGLMFYTHYDLEEVTCYCPDDGWEYTYEAEINPVVWKKWIDEPGPGEPVMNMPGWMPAADPTGNGVYVTSTIDGSVSVYYLDTDGSGVEFVAGGEGGFAYYPTASFLHRTNIRALRDATFRAR